ncbi:glycosyltransferase family 2 protein [Lysobacter sp. H21R4]|uniref:glycosyltransferase family 2 protein n=1 Tax=Lysobacter sp. H21R4 TaxID=2781021 RepID=UPI0018878B57|nr:glycosyltransferase family 2 protein [Lysobacter sp. H21R4]QOY62008.1 glycosyltransferase family 2 protein [Lysobacter sp. H21R4]
MRSDIETLSSDNGCCVDIHGWSSKEPFFSIIIPCYNRAAEVQASLNSVLAQTFSDFECIIVDDGSEDSDMLRSQVDSLEDSRFVYLWQRNGGGGAARNTGIIAARGKYVAFLDSDDAFLPEKLQIVSHYLESTGAQAVYSRAYVDRGVGGRLWVRPDRGIGVDEDMGEYLFVSNQFVPTPTIVMRTLLARQILFDPSLRKGQDLDFCLRAHHLGVRFEMIDKPLIVWVDALEAGRASRHSGALAPSEWLRRSTPLMTAKAKLGYRATVLAYYQPKWKFWLVLWDLSMAIFVAGVPLRIVVRQWLRFLLPRSAYRKLANSIVLIRGVKRQY